MRKVLDAAGKECPIPVIIAKKEIEANHADFDIIVDNDIAVQNLTKLASSKGYSVQSAKSGELITVSFISGGAGACEIMQDEEIQNVAAGVGNGSWVVFMGKDHVGEGAQELGSNLAKMFFYTLSQEEDLPASILFMNGGVNLPTKDEQVIEHLKVLRDKGVEILVCGTCLDYYGLKDELKIGEISNMYEIAGRMFRASKVVTV
ncbi:MAG: sulfurtransferase-like selenium metabolism protein YedF [Eubacteriaceae bacterium]|jgi:selenium metabolism protein YedF|nr:sulfurtransferase-like selenium metabolism protein YedF [Eubacteriaceae bacterium]